MNAIASVGAQAKHFATSPVVKAVAITLGVYFLLMATQILPMFGITSRPDLTIGASPRTGVIFALLGSELQSASRLTYLALGPFLCILLNLRTRERFSVAQKLEPMLIAVMVASFVTLWLVAWVRPSPKWIDANSISQVLFVETLYMSPVFAWFIVWRYRLLTLPAIAITSCWLLLRTIELSTEVWLPPLVKSAATPVQAIELFSQQLSTAYISAGILFLAIGVCASALREKTNWLLMLLAASIAVLSVLHGPISLLTGMSRYVYFELVAYSADTLLVLGLGAIYIVYTVSQVRLARRTHELQQLATLETSYAEARALTLSAQIEPHFLFNTLAHVLRLKNTNHSQGKVLLSALIHYFEAALPRLRSEKPTLRDELVLVEAYLTILQRRMNERLSFFIDAPEGARGYPFPRMMLLTLVENAYKHGLMPLPLGGSIFISARCVGEYLHVEVTDTGHGFNAEATGGTGVGLANIRARLNSAFGGRASLELKLRKPQGITAALVIPTLATD